MSDNFQVTTAIKKLYHLKERKHIIQGGTSAGKTFGIIPILIDRAIKTPLLEISIVSESVPHLRRGVVKDFLKIMMLTGRYREEQYNKTEMKYTFRNGSYIEFFSVDQPDKLRGARRSILYVNEANNITFESYHQLAIRTSGEIWLDFNPTNKFWAHTEVMTEPESDFLLLTYEDNEALPDTIIRDIESARLKADSSKYWKNWWKVYGLGQIGSLEGACIPDWSIIPKVPEEARLLGYGMDFGYTNDPTTLIAIYKWNNAYIYDELIYSTGLLNSDISNLLKELKVTEFIYADSAEPKSIAELAKLGHKILPCKKGSDSIRHGISIINQHPTFVTKRSENIQNELQNYTWKKDKENNPINIPIDKFNHTIDAMRYGLTSLLANPNKGVYSIW